ncbi:E3 ubiquitin protein ligase RIN2 isoform X2 [Daucus carota subsp. sativus]|uniref:E3 ubiquitin protein ligase RIN2 isoform X2 n=1 Tax=Daucus carota subsp. sativus TaxID=79200 RepID=UPI0007B2B823|nr:PREDICTED: E3 ubiquitin protein ligase RIN2 isoform X2 [Daucus carota subsp. sativus]
MGVSYVTISLFSTALSYAGLRYWTILSPEKLLLDGLISQSFVLSENVVEALESLLDSYTSIALVANFVFNIFVLAILSLKTIFFAELHSSESRKLVERLVNYVIYKGTFLPLVVPPTIYQGSLWTAWLVILCSLKMFQALARDRLDRLNASPSATPWTYFRVYSVLLLVFIVDLLWIRTCLMLYGTIVSSMFFLLFYEPLSILFETLQAIVVHGFQLLDIWLHNSAKDSTSQGSLNEWKGILVRNLGFVLDMMTLLMALGHYVHIWWLHGMAFHLVDAVLFLNIRALLSAIVKRNKGFIKLTIALSTLHGALPDATHEELQAYDDECAICREPMAKAKKLSCHHLFHLACLRSWLDQGLNNNYLCPTCRKPLFVGRPEDDVNPRAREVSSDEQLARQLSSRLDRLPPAPNLPAGVSPDQTVNPLDGGDWRGGGTDSAWLGFDGAGPSTTMRSVGLGRVQMMMRHLAAVGETYAQTALEDNAWNLWSASSSQASTSSSTVTSPGSVRYSGNAGGVHVRTSRAANENLASILAMAETVREVLPHVPDELIFQDLQRTNSVTVTVNNLLRA